jgi:hypothetical protein
MTTPQVSYDNGELDYPGIDWPEIPHLDPAAMLIHARTERAVALGRALEARAQHNDPSLHDRLEDAKSSGKSERFWRGCLTGLPRPRAQA